MHQPSTMYQVEPHLLNQQTLISEVRVVEEARVSGREALHHPPFFQLVETGRAFLSHGVGLEGALSTYGCSALPATGQRPVLVPCTFCKCPPSIHELVKPWKPVCCISRLNSSPSWLPHTHQPRPLFCHRGSCSRQTEARSGYADHLPLLTLGLPSAAQQRYRCPRKLINIGPYCAYWRAGSSGQVCTSAYFRDFLLCRLAWSRPKESLQPSN